VITEGWIRMNGFCPSCGNSLKQFTGNKPVADFYCNSCNEEYELKSKVGKLTKMIPDGAYITMLNRLKSQNNPSLFLLSYNREQIVTNLIVIPKYFFIPEIIKARKPLSKTARRAGWEGCNIDIGAIPEPGKIYLMKDGAFLSRKIVLQNWNRTSFLGSTGKLETRQWLITLMRCIEKLHKSEFNLQEVYNFEDFFKAKFPKNSNIRPKIRQQLQVLRDMNYLEFLGNGKYSLRSINS
jgi:type II restriction enzyme